MGMGSVLGNASLIKKVYMPKFIFPISRVMSSFVNLLFSLAAIAGHGDHPVAVLLDDSARLGAAFAAAGVLLPAWRCCSVRWRSTSAICNICTAS